MKWLITRKGNKYRKKRKLDFEEWFTLAFIALLLNLFYLVLIIEGA